MDLSSIIKKKLNVLIYVLIGLFVFVILFSAIVPQAFGIFMRLLGLEDGGPYKQPGSVWISDDPEIFLQVSDSHNIAESCYILVNGERIPAGIAAQNGLEVIVESSSDRMKRIMGPPKLFSNKKVVFVVTEDSLFDGEYIGREITLYRQS